MARTQIPGIFILSSLLFGPSLAAQQKFPTIVYEVKETVVKVEIHLVNTQDHESVSDQLKLCFKESDYCVIGAGVRINDDGVVLTAAHVARDTTVASQILLNLGIESEVMIAGEARNAEYVKNDVSTPGGAFRASIMKIDPEHDIALLEPEGSPLKQEISAIDSGSRLHRRPLQTARISVQSPDVAEALFAFGFAMFSPALITTPGSVVSATGSKSLIEAKKSGEPQPVPVLRAKLDINPGNSGGPLFRSSDGALLGIESEIGDERGIVATVIPASEIARFLSANAITWNAAAPSQQANVASSKASHRKSRH